MSFLGHARRLWTEDQKRALVAEADAPGSSINSVAKRRNMRPSLIFHWCKRFRSETAVPEVPERLRGLPKLPLPVLVSHESRDGHRQEIPDHGP
jgi:transposase-like protein